MSMLESLYDKCPIFFQNVMVSVKGAINFIQRYGHTYRKELKFLDEFDTYTIAEKEKYQFNQLKSFVEFAYNNSNFYHKKYENIDFSLFNNIEFLKNLPMVEKEEIRENIDEICTNYTKKYVVNHTGGTTGKSLSVKMSCEDLQKRMAMLDHYKKRIGFINLKMKRVTINGKKLSLQLKLKRSFGDIMHLVSN